MTNAEKYKLDLRDKLALYFVRSVKYLCDPSNITAGTSLRSISKPSTKIIPTGITYAVIEAENNREAERIARDRDNAGEYDDEWFELEPAVKTTYWANEKL